MGFLKQDFSQAAQLYDISRDYKLSNSISFYASENSSLWIIYLKSVVIKLTFDRLNSVLLVYLLAAVFEK